MGKGKRNRNKKQISIPNQNRRSMNKNNEGSRVNGPTDEERANVQTECIKLIELGLELQRMAQISLSRVGVNAKPIMDEVFAERSALPQMHPIEFCGRLADAQMQFVQIVEHTAYQQGRTDVIREAKEEVKAEDNVDGQTELKLHVPDEDAPESPGTAPSCEAEEAGQESTEDVD